MKETSKEPGVKVDPLCWMIDVLLSEENIQELQEQIPDLNKIPWLCGILVPVVISFFIFSILLPKRETTREDKCFES